MAKTNLGSMSVEQLLQLRDDVGRNSIAKALNYKANWQGWVGRLRQVGDVEVRPKGKKVPAKYRDKAGNAWAGRGGTPDG